MPLSRKTVLVLGFSVAVVAASGHAFGALYTVDGRANVISEDPVVSPVLVDLPGPGDYTVTLTASDFKENSGNTTPQRHVIVWAGISGWDNRVFSLNGIGDSKTLYLEHDLKLLFVDGLVSDNVGGSTVEVTGDGSLVGEFLVDGKTNVFSQDPVTTPVVADIPAIGDYTVTLVASDFKENAGNTAPQRHVLVWAGNSAGDNRIFSLNGIGDSKTLHFENDLKLFFIDGLVIDNVGASVVEVIPEPATVSFLGAGIVALFARRRRRA
jgi:hypothetical protein